MNRAYFAYELNVLSERLYSRIGKTPVIGIARLEVFDLAFQKAGLDGSGKCSLRQNKTGSYVDGVLYNLTGKLRKTLCLYENPGRGYITRTATEKCSGYDIDAVTYEAIRIQTGCRRDIP